MTDEATEQQETEAPPFLTDKERKDRAMAFVVQHDGFWRDRQHELAQAAAAYETRWWEWIHGEGKAQVSAEIQQIANRYETNRIKPAVSTYLSQLFPRTMRTEASRVAGTTGEPKMAALAVNNWMFDLKQRQRWDSAVRQALLYPGVGFRFAVNHDDMLQPDERVEMYVCPIWEMVLDREVYDARHQRYIGHVGWRPLEEVAQWYGLDRDQLTGQRRSDFLDASSRAGDAKSPGDSTPDARAASLKDPHAKWVRVLELCNFTEDFEGTDGERYRGSFEIHLLDQPKCGKAGEPLYIGPLPAMDPDGNPAPHIFAHFFETRAEYPLQGVAPAHQWMPQQRELNAYRSQMADKASRDKVIWIAPAFLPEDQRNKITSARDQEVVFVDQKVWREMGGNPDRLIVPLQAAKQSTDVKGMAELADQDLMATIALSPSAMGVRQNVTAEEIQYQRDFTDSEFGRYAASWERTLEALAEAYLQMLAAAMRPEPDGDWSFTYSEDGEADAEGDEGDDEDVVDDDTVEPDYSVERDPDAEKSPMMRAAPTEADKEESPEPDEDKVRDRVKARAHELVLYDTTGGEVTVTAEDIDSWFRFSFSDVGRTPGARIEIRSNLIEVLPRYMEFWAMAQKGGPEGIFAMAALRSIFDNFTLPANLDPERLMAELDDEKKQKEPGESPMDRAAAPPPSEAPEDPAMAALAAIEQEFGADPAIKAKVDEVRALPPEQRLPAAKQLIQQLQAMAAQQQPAPPPPGQPVGMA